MKGVAHAAMTTEADLLARFAGRGLTAQRWSNAPGAVYGSHEHPYGKVLAITAGSITLTVEAPTRVVRLRAGDWLELPPRTAHRAVVGPEGVVCLEAHC